MRIIWKDSNTKEYRPVKYRGYIIERFNNGWTISYPGDNNIYKSTVSAMNALDQYLGIKDNKPIPKRHSLGVNIIEKK